MSAYFKSVYTIFELLRWGNCVMAGFGGLVGTLIAFMTLPHSMEVQLIYEPVMVFLVIFLITGAGNAVNDYFDTEIDRINRPERPVPSGRIAKRAALYLSLSLFGIGIILSCFIGPICLFLAAFNSFLLFLYASTFKRMAVIGNMVIGYLTGSTFLFGSALEVFEGTGIKSTAILFGLAALVTMSREIIKDIQDLEGDRQAGAQTLPIRIGKEQSARIAAVLGLIGVMLSPVPYLFNSAFGISYLGVIFIGDMLLLGSINEILLQDNPGKSSKLLKLAMITALVAFIVGAIL